MGSRWPGLLLPILLLAAQPARCDPVTADTTQRHDAASLTALAFGAAAVDSAMGDLTGEGRDDAVLVIDPLPGADCTKNAHPLHVVLLRRDAAGQLRKVATNTKLLVCWTGSTGSRPDYIRVQAGTITIVDPGSGTGQQAEYDFAYDRERKDWFVTHVSSGPVGTRSGGTSRTDLAARNLGKTSFAGFDPAHLPSPEGVQGR